MGGSPITVDRPAGAGQIRGMAHHGTVPMAERRHHHRGESPSASSESVQTLTDRIRTLASAVHAAQSELVDLLVTLDDEDGWTGAGITSLPHWLTLTCAMTRPEADRYGTAVRRRDELPALFGAFRSGALSMDYLHLAQRHATADTDEQVTDIATRATAPQAARAFAAFATTDEARDAKRRAAGDATGDDLSSTADDAGDVPPGPCSPGADHPDARDPIDPGVWLATWWDAQQHLRIDGRLGPTDGATLMTLLDRLRDRDPADPAGPDPARPDDAPPQDHGTTGGQNGSAPGGSEHDDGSTGDGCHNRSTSDDQPAGSPTDPAPEEPGAAAGGDPSADPRRSSSDWLTRPEAFSSLLRLAGDALTHAGVAGRWTDRFMITATVDADVLTGARPGNGLLPDGTPVPAHVIRSWLGSSRLEALVTRRGAPLFLGRAARFARLSQRRALLARDGGCAFPACGRTTHLAAHHAHSWAAGGPTDIDQLVLLCPRHHRQHHAGEFGIAMVDGRPRIHSDAIPVPQHTVGDPPRLLDRHDPDRHDPTGTAPTEPVRLPLRCGAVVNR